jgi:hypothetical protein
MWQKLKLERYGTDVVLRGSAWLYSRENQGIGHQPCCCCCCLFAYHVEMVEALYRKLNRFSLVALPLCRPFSFADWRPDNAGMDTELSIAFCVSGMSSYQ